MLAMLQIEGSGWFPYFKIFRFNDKKQKWMIYYSGKGPLGDWGLVYPIIHPFTGYTFFFEEVRDFDNKRLISYDLLSFKNKKWKVTESVRARYVYNLSEEEQKWISPEIIEKMAAFDYSFMGIEKDHPEIIERKFDDKKIVAKLFYTSVGRMASNYYITIYKNSSEEEKLLYSGNCQWGLNFVEKDGKHYLVYIGPGSTDRVTIENFMLNVIDLSTLEIEYQSYISCDIIFE